MFLSELLAKIPLTVKKTVEDTMRQHNRLVREALRDELRLRLSRRDELRVESEQESVLCAVDVGAPEAVMGLHIPEELRLVAELSLYRVTLEQMAHENEAIAQVLARHPEAVEAQLGVSFAEPQPIDPPPQLSWGQRVSVEARSAREVRPPEVLLASGWIAAKLLPGVEAFDLAKRVLAFERDVLGQYSWNPTNRIQLFWGVIGLVAIDLGVKVEDLTVVVLAHELAHAYTHLGVDINGARWSDADFARLDTPVAEGLAQYYTHRVMTRLGERIPGGVEVFKKLLSKQPLAYHAHEPWLTAGSGEAVRQALIECRSNQVYDHAKFTRHLEEAQGRIGRPRSRLQD